MSSNSEDHEYETCVVRNDNGEDLEFDGYLIARVSSQSSSDARRWSELSIYMTRAQSRVCEQVGHSSVEGEKPLCKAIVARSDKDVTKFFGHGWLAKQLYRAADVVSTRRVA